MKTFYRLKENGTILDFCEFENDVDIPAFIQEQYKETDRKIIKLTDGGLAFEDEVNQEEESKKEIAKLKEAKTAAFKAARNAEEIAPIEWNGNLFDYDADSRDRLSIKRRNIEDNGGTGTVKWTLADNTHTVIGLADFIGINNAASDRSEALHYKYNVLKAQAEAATTKEELESIVW